MPNQAIPKMLIRISLKYTSFYKYFCIFFVIRRNSFWQLVTYKAIIISQRILFWKVPYLHNEKYVMKNDWVINLSQETGRSPAELWIGLARQNMI